MAKTEGGQRHPGGIQWEEGAKGRVTVGNCKAEESRPKALAVSETQSLLVEISVQQAVICQSPC